MRVKESRVPTRTLNHGQGRHVAVNSARHSAPSGSADAGVAPGRCDDPTWDPRVDPALSCRYSIDDVERGKRENRAALADALNLLANEDPLIAFVDPAADRDGAALLAEAGAALLQMNARFVIVGSGDAGLTHGLRTLEALAPERVACSDTGEPDVLRWALAAADILLMPSGIGAGRMLHSLALRYGAIPVACAAGASSGELVGATIQTLARGRANAVVYRDASPTGLCRAVLMALDLWRDPGIRHAIRRCGMRGSPAFTRQV